MAVKILSEAVDCVELDLTTESGQPSQFIANKSNLVY